MTEWKPGDVANGHILGEDLVWRPVEQSDSGGQQKKSKLRSADWWLGKTDEQQTAKAEARAELRAGIERFLPSSQHDRDELKDKFRGVLSQTDRVAGMPGSPEAIITEDGDVKCPYCGAGGNFRLKRGKGKFALDAWTLVGSGGMAGYSALLGKYGMPAQLKCLTCGRRMSRPSGPSPADTPGDQAQTMGEPDVADQIRKLAELRDQGVLTDEEFDAKKRQILGL